MESSNNSSSSHHLDPGLFTVHKGYLLSTNPPYCSNDDYLVQSLLDPSLLSETLTNYENYTIDPSKLSIKTPLAQGAFGKIYEGCYNTEDVAIKLLQRLYQDEFDTKHLLIEHQVDQEIKMMTKLNHQNISRFIGACKKKNVWCILTEHEKGGSVRQFLLRRKHESVPLKLAVTQALDIARGMTYVHEMGFIHRDLKSENLLISADKHVKISGFNVARIEVNPEGMTPETGTYRWMAPEMIQHKPYDKKVDVYSFGIVLWELVTGRVPFENMTAVQAAFAVVNKGARPIIPHDCNEMLSELMKRCWDVDPLERPCFDEIVKILEQVETEVVTGIRKARFRMKRSKLC
ncbi:hypothetical protein LUZ60_016175 [Juncus effusus]|nr:hypothetical protein LUZ60_016175 [Juncus effusus]